MFMKKQFTHLMLTIVVLVCLSLLSFDLKSQCSNCGSEYPAGYTSTTSASWTTKSGCVWGSEYSLYTLNSGYMYQWSTCGDTDFDTELTLYPSNTCANTSTTWHPGPYLLGYNDNACGLQSVLNYSGSQTSVRVLLTKKTCLAENTCMTLNWRAIPKTPTISGGGVTICNGQSTNLTASNIGNNDSYVSVYWGTTSGGSQVSSDATTVSVSPTSTTTYYLRYVLTGDNYAYSNVVSTTVTVRQPPTAPTGVSGTATICQGSSLTLSATGGSVGSGATYQWYAGGCGSGSVLGTGSSITVTPSSTTTYYVRRVGNSPFNSTVTGFANGTITVKSVSVVPSSINTQINP